MQQAAYVSGCLQKCLLTSLAPPNNVKYSHCVSYYNMYGISNIRGFGGVILGGEDQI